MIRVYVLNVPEFRPLVDYASDISSCHVDESHPEYTVISSEATIAFNRRAMKLKPAVWYGLFTGGMDAQILDFGREEVKLGVA